MVYSEYLRDQQFWDDWFLLLQLREDLEQARTEYFTGATLSKFDVEKFKKEFIGEID